MCGESNRPTFGGTIAVLFPLNNVSSSAASERSRSSSPDSISSNSSVSSLSSYSLFFRDAEKSGSRHTKAIFQFNDTETYEALRECRQVDMRIEKYGDLSTATPNTVPLHSFRLDLAQSSATKSGHSQAEMEFELAEQLDLGVSAKGVIGRQVSVSDADGLVLGVGIVGYN
ncbi:uncharacterized protein N7473_010138 [Penicillium subrubescens]|uniref:uncharacterized protein n=1 Tax=Penicillium subrubescens TaxID=1316194 RepID=UPI0025451870|nr:uncharacterized protein N7473_010138 [Penicillium subrubescens]KAJ5883252.1 hypothetical protein N7473_010138 [Penicillium subrubescens]